MGRRAYTMDDWRRRLSALEIEKKTASTKRLICINVSIWKIRRMLHAAKSSPNVVSASVLEMRNSRAIRRMWSTGWGEDVA